MKMWERVIVGRVRQEVQISQQQYGFMQGKHTVDVIFPLRMMIEKYIQGKKELLYKPGEGLWQGAKARAVALYETVRSD